MRYLAVPEMPRRSLWASLLRRSHWPEWHAVADTAPKPIRTLCGSPYTSEAHRTWDQTMSGARCLQCEGLVTAARKAKGPTFVAEGPTSVLGRPPRPRAPQRSPK